MDFTEFFKFFFYRHKRKKIVHILFSFLELLIYYIKNNLQDLVFLTNACQYFVHLSYLYTNTISQHNLVSFDILDRPNIVVSYTVLIRDMQYRELNEHYLSKLIVNYHTQNLSES